MINKLFVAVERIVAFSTNYPFMCQQILENSDELFWLICALIDSLQH